MSTWKTRIKMPAFLLATAFIMIAAAVGFYFGQSHVSTARSQTLHTRLATDPQPGHGKDCPYPPQGNYGHPDNGHVAPGRDKHCNGDTGKGH